MIKKWNLAGDKKGNTKILLGCKLGKTERAMITYTENFVLVDAKKKVRGFMTVLIKRISKIKYRY
jgi:hypothetical protein